MPIHNLCRLVHRAAKRYSLTRRQAKWRQHMRRAYHDYKAQYDAGHDWYLASAWLRHCQRQVWTIREELRGIA